MTENNSEPSHTPNHISLSSRWFYAIASPLIVAYGAYGIWIDDLFLPGKRGPGTHLHGVAAWLMFAAIVAAALNMVSVIIDHFDTRNNETNYRRFAKITSWSGFALAAVSFAWFILHKSSASGT